MFLDDLKDFDQCFITGTAAEVTPVCAIDDQNFVVGDEIKKISSSYIDLVNNWSGDQKLTSKSLLFCFTHLAPFGECSFFQNGAFIFKKSIMYSLALNASFLCFV